MKINGISTPFCPPAKRSVGKICARSALPRVCGNFFHGTCTASGRLYRPDSFAGQRHEKKIWTDIFKKLRNLKKIQREN